MHRFPNEEYKLPGLHEYTVVETKPKLTFKDLKDGDVFWEPQTRTKYRKLTHDTIEALEPDFEWQRVMVVTDGDFKVELV